MRPMNTFDLAEQDVYIELGKALSSQIIFKWPGDERTTGYSFLVAEIDKAAALTASFLAVVGLAFML